MIRAVIRRHGVVATVFFAVLCIAVRERPHAQTSFQSMRSAVSTAAFPRAIIRLGDGVTPSLVRPRASIRGPQVNSSTFEVTYTGFTVPAQAAFQAAVDLWQTQVQSSVPIKVSASWSALPPGVLGQAGPLNYYRGPSFPRANTWYPVALANRLAVQDLDPIGADMEAEFNSAFGSWYFGTDGHPPVGQIDFVSVVLHEIGHGLGFTGSMDVAGGLGSWGYTSGFPFIFDRFTYNPSGFLLLDTYPNNSAGLAAALTNNNVFFDGANARQANGGSAARLYAPGTWNDGSSYSHLDESTYGVGNPNSLMTPTINYAEAIHDPGPITRGIFADMGWGLGTGCTYSLTTTAFSAGAAAATSSVNVNTTGGCGWSAVSNNSFLTVTGGSTGTGPGTVTFSIASNVVTNTQRPARFGTMTIAGQTFTVTQSGCSYGISPGTAAYDESDGGGTVGVTAGAGCTWTAVSNDAFLVVTGGASGTGNGTMTYTLAANTAPPNVQTGPRSGTVSVAGHTFTATQTGCTFAISRENSVVGSTGGPGSVDVTTPAACSWTVTGGDVWVSTTSGGSGTGSGTWHHGVSPNAGSTRGALFAVAGRTFMLTQLAVPLKTMTSGDRSSFTLANASAEMWSAVETVGGRSYCAELAAGANAQEAATPVVTALRADGTTILAGGGSGDTHACFVAPVNETTLIKVAQADASVRSYRLRLIESTLWSNWFFVGGTYSSYTLLRNTGDADINATITWRADSGAVVGSFVTVVPAHGVVYYDARTMTTAALAGSVEVGHDGPPQGLVGSQTTLTPSTGLSFDTVMMQRLSK
jgi:hypothetical protein